MFQFLFMFDRSLFHRTQDLNWEMFDGKILEECYQINCEQK